MRTFSDEDGDAFVSNDYQDDDDMRENPSERCGPFKASFLFHTKASVAVAFEDGEEKTFVATSLIEDGRVEVWRTLQGQDRPMKNLQLMRPDVVYKFYGPRWWAEGNNL